MTEPPPVCMMCKSPMVIVHVVPTPKENDITILAMPFLSHAEYL